MSPRAAALAVGFTAMSLFVVACAPSSTSPTLPTSPVVGVVIRVNSAGLNDVRGFELRTGGGVMLQFEIGDLENAVQFPPGHLKEHMATSSPVRVSFDVEGSRLVVYRLEDG